MTRRSLFVLLCCLPLIGGQADTAQAEKPRLVIVHAGWCGPCRNFHHVWNVSPTLRTTLSAAFEIRELDWERPEERQRAIAYGVRALPTFVAIRGDRVFAKSEGFAQNLLPITVRGAVNKLMLDLGVEWPRAITAPDSEEPPPVEPQPIPQQQPQPAPQIYIPHIDQTARDAVDKLAAKSRELQQAQNHTQNGVQALQGDVTDVRSKIGDVRTNVEQSREALSQQLQKSQDLTHNKIGEISATLQNSIDELRNAIPPIRDGPPPVCTIPPAPAPTPTPRPTPPDSSPELRPEPPGPTASKWLIVGAWLAKTGVAIAAPELALPLSLGLGVAGWLLSRRRNRKGSGLWPGTFPGQSGKSHTPDYTAPAGPVRDNSEIEQILSLRQQEQRDPIHDALFGVLFEDEYRAKPDQPIKEAWLSAMDRFNNIAPLSTSTKTQSVSSTTTQQGN